MEAGFAENHAAASAAGTNTLPRRFKLRQYGKVRTASRLLAQLILGQPEALSTAQPGRKDVYKEPVHSNWGLILSRFTTKRGSKLNVVN